jgi:hypothetical protein
MVPLIDGSIRQARRTADADSKDLMETLANMIGTARARVGFFMNRFRKHGVLDCNGRPHVHKSLLNVVLHYQIFDSNSAKPDVPKSSINLAGRRNRLCRSKRLNCRDRTVASTSMYHGRLVDSHGDGVILAKVGAGASELFNPKAEAIRVAGLGGSVNN